MAVPIFTLPQQPGLSEFLGQALGTGIGGLGHGVGGFLQNLAQLKMQDIAQRQQSTRTASALQELLGLSPEQAQAAAGAPESILKEFTKRKLLEPSQQAYLQQLQAMFGNEQTPMSPELQKSGISEQQATKLAELGMKQKESKATEQRHYEKLYIPEIKRIRSEGKAARKAYETTKRFKDVIDRNKAQLGNVVAGKFIPREWLNKDTQELISLGNELVLKRAQTGKGVPTKFRLALEELAKPGIWMTPEVAKARINDIQEELLEDIAAEKAVKNVIAKKGISKDFETLSDKETEKELTKLKKIQEKQPNAYSELPPASQFEGKIARNPATGQKMKSVNGQWVPIKE